MLTTMVDHTMVGQQKCARWMGWVKLPGTATMIAQRRAILPTRLHEEEALRPWAIRPIPTRSRRGNLYPSPARH